MAAEILSDTVSLWRFNETAITFTSTCVIVYADTDKTSCTLKGLAYGVDSKDRRELAEYLHNNGVIDCYYERRKDGRTLHKKWSINSKCKITKL